MKKCESMVNIFIPILPILFDSILDAFSLYDLLFVSGDITKPSTYQIQKINSLNIIISINISILIFVLQFLELKYISNVIIYILSILIIILCILSLLAIILAKNDKFNKMKFRFYIRFSAILIILVSGTVLEIIN